MQALIGALLPAAPALSLILGNPLIPADPAEGIEIIAYLEAEELEVGGVYSFILDANFDDGANASGAGIPAPILQLQVPPSVRLEGRYLESFAELTKNEFLVEPYERLLETLPAEISFKLIAEPAPGETIGINFLAYVARGVGMDAGEAGEPPFFLRRRLELPVVPLGEAIESSPTNSEWGVDEELLQIGDAAPEFNLPRADGTSGSNAAYLGRKNLIVMTYRAFW